MAANANVGTAPGSIPSSSGTSDAEGQQMKQFSMKEN